MTINYEAANISTELNVVDNRDPNTKYFTANEDGIYSNDAKVNTDAPLQVVAHRGILPGAIILGSAASNITLGESRIPVVTGPERVSDLRLAFTGFYVLAGASGETDNPNDMTVRGGIEYTAVSAAAKTPYIGDFDIVVKAGIGHVVTEPVGYTVTANSTIYIQMSTAITSGQSFPATQLSGTNSIGYTSSLAASASQVGTVGPWSGTSRTSNYAATPVAILGRPEKPFPSVAIIGDSIGDGSGESGAADDNGNYGWVCRGLTGVGTNSRTIPYIRITKAGEAAVNFTNGKAQRRCALIQYVSHVISQLGTNDAAGANLAACQARLKAVWIEAKARNKKVVQCLLMPRTTSTDSWATAANQSPVSGFEVGGVRDQLNAWIITQVGQGLLDGYIDPNPYVENQTTRGVWITTGAANYPTTDGVHPTTALHVLAAAAVRAWAADNVLTF